MVGDRLGRYLILEPIGAGGMGQVFRARDERLQREVAIKLLPEGALSDPEARARFRREALLLSKLNHPNIETIHDFDSHEDLDFLVMEYLPGSNLHDKIAAERVLPEDEVLRVGLQLAQGLHERGHCRYGSLHGSGTAARPTR
jgi:serine/threonine protein kinase